MNDKQGKTAFVDDNETGRFRATNLRTVGNSQWEGSARDTSESRMLRMSPLLPALCSGLFEGRGGCEGPCRQGIRKSRRLSGFWNRIKSCRKSTVFCCSRTSGPWRKTGGLHEVCDRGFEVAIVAFFRDRSLHRYCRLPRRRMGQAAQIPKGAAPPWKAALP